MNRRTRMGLIASLIAAILLPVLPVTPLAPRPALAVGSYDNAKIADIALSRLGQHGGQCKTFVNNVVRDASGGSQWPAPGYHSGFKNAGGIEVSSANARKGDIIQVGNSDNDWPLHTAIVVRNDGGGKFWVVDSNYGNTERVSQHAFSPYVWGKGSLIKIWRMGTVKTTTPKAPGDVKNGGFEGTASWSASGVNFTTYPAQNPTKPQQGSRFAAVNNPSSGGSLKQDVSGTVANGTTYCVTAMVTTRGTGSGAFGTLALWMLGGSKNEKSQVRYANLAGGNKWTEIRTCATATTGHSKLRVEFYPGTNTKDTGIDKVALSRSYTNNGGFEAGSTGWRSRGGANFKVYSGGAYEGNRYGATNNNGRSGSSVYSDVKMTTAKGHHFCTNIRVRAKGGASGTVAVWFLGGTSEKISLTYTTPKDGSWVNVGKCITLKWPHASIRSELYAGKTDTHFDAWGTRRH